MEKSTEPVSNNQTILLGRKGSGTDIDLFVVNYDTMGDVTVEQVDLQQNGVSIDSSDYMFVCSGEGAFTPSPVTVLSYTIDTSTISSSKGIMQGTTMKGTKVTFRLAQIISMAAGDPGSVVFGVINTEPIGSF